MTERDHRLIRAAYWAMIDQIDHNVGRIVQYLKDVGQYDDTLIIFPPTTEKAWATTAFT